MAYIGPLQEQIERKLLSDDDLLQRIVIETTAASDARMGGAALPAMVIQAQIRVSQRLSQW